MKRFVEKVLVAVMFRVDRWMEEHAR